MKKIVLGLFLLSQISIAQKTKTLNNELFFSSQIEIKNLKNHLYTLASDEFEGRKTGEQGQKLAAEYIRNFYKKNKIDALPGTDNYFQFIPSDYMSRRFSPKLKDSENVIAYIKGNLLPDEYIVISAHYDHVGTANNEIFNGADDNASGNSAILEMAKLLKKASDNGVLKRSVIFLHCTGEEYGLHGSRFFTSYPLVPIENIKANINIDMIGRIDYKYQNNGNYIYVVGSLEQGKHLYDFLEAANKNLKLTIDYTYDDRKHPEMIFYRSDHYNFAKYDIPVLFFHSGEHDDYHQPTDTADKIDYNAMKKRLQLIFQTVWKTINQ